MYNTIPGTVFNSKELMTNKIYEPTYISQYLSHSTVADATSSR